MIQPKMIQKVSRRWLLFATFLGLLWMTPSVQNEELFTAQVELEAVFASQTAVVEAMEIYLAKERVRLEELQRRLRPLDERSRQNSYDVVSNPLSAFLLIKSLTVDLDDLLHFAQRKENVEELVNGVKNLKTTLKFPSMEDLNGAAVAITRLQDTYLLDTSAMARGEVDGHCCTSELSVDDCFELGRQSYNVGDHDHTIMWMNEALNKAEEAKRNASNQLTIVSQPDILEYLAFSSYQKGEISRALTLTRKLLTLDPNHSRAKGNIVHYEKLLVDKKGEDGVESDQSLAIKERRIDQVGWEKAKYEALCRGENQKFQPGLACRYSTSGSLALLIGPAKEELVHRNPNIYIYHDVVFDDEINVIQELAQPRFKRATVHNHETGELMTAKYRISKSAWLQGDENPVVDKVNRRVRQLTGLAMETAEELQVVNYGLGGHYEPHYDFARREEKDAFQSLGTGNRIATFLFYMTDVEAGGATVFPSLDLTLWPKRGSAAFWYNLFEDGNGDLSTRHAGCPVLRGSKWVSNKWLHERGQEFLRPCNLKPTQQPSDLQD